MANCHKIFLKFNNSIALTSDRKKTLRTSRDAVREKIRKYFREKQNGFTPKFHGQGSFMMNTIIEPSDGEFDIDDGIYFQVEKEPSYRVSTFHQWIYEAINSHTKEKPSDRNTCVRLIYAGQYHIDLPIYYVIQGQNPYLAHKTEGWIKSDPREFIKWFNKKADSNGQLKRIVRYLKAWSDHRKGDLPSGLIFSILATNHIVFDERDDIALHKTLRNIKFHLGLNFACYRPTTPAYENLLENYSETNKKYLLTQLDNFIRSAEKALSEETNQEDACKAWQQHFGRDRFPCESSEKLTDSFANKSLIASIQNRNNVISYKDTEQFIENYFVVSLQYHLKINCQVSQKGFLTRRLHEMLFKNIPLLPGRKLEFYIENCDVPKPFEVKWKVRNVGQEAKKRDCIRGQIVSDAGQNKLIESSNFWGEHFVECYIIKNNVCVARCKIEVPIQVL